MSLLITKQQEASLDCVGVHEPSLCVHWIITMLKSYIITTTVSANSVSQILALKYNVALAIRIVEFEAKVKVLTKMSDRLNVFT